MGLYKYQERVRDLMLDGQSVILQAPTGAGKTRAALTPFLETFWDAPSTAFPKKCVYIVPMRVLANQFTEELREEAARYRRIYQRDVAVGRQTGEYSEDIEFRKELTFTTIDQVLSSWLIHPYSLSARQGNLNAGAFVGSYLIFDEFHLFDPDSSLPTTLHMLKTLGGISPFLLMTATFSADMLSELARELGATDVLLDDDDLRDIPSQNKERRFYVVDRPMVTDDEVFIDGVVSAHMEQPPGDQRSLVVCNQVERAQRVYQALRQHPDLTGVEVRLVHSRFLRPDRQKLEAEIRHEFHKENKRHTQPSMIVVGTQVVEVGLDISCRTMHTELAPAAAVLQRAGRCARYEGDMGDVHVYHVEPDKLHPYHGKEAKQQCALTWEWLTAYNGQRLDFPLEQVLINHAHGPTDQRLMAGLRGTELGHRERIFALWRGDGSRAEAANLIRNIQAVTIVVHSDPDQLRRTPFNVESFSLHPGTLQGKFEAWQKENNTLDPDWDSGRLPWLVQKLVEIEDEADAQGNRPIRYDFKPVTHPSELFAPLLVVHPNLVGYSSELGLTLYPTEYYEGSLPPLTPTERKQSGYRVEEYKRHIQLVHGAYIEEWQEWIAIVGRRIERAYDWQPGIVSDMADLVICLHDVGKLSLGWQQWAGDWQTAVGNSLPPGVVVAHTDYDPDNERHRALDREMRRKRPNHAVESAYAAIPLLLSILPDKDKHRPLLRAAFTAISRHHGAFTSHSGSYRLVEDCRRYVGETLSLLPEALRSVNPVDLWLRLDHDDKAQRGINERFLIRVENEPDIVSYLALVRALRFADQEGTKLGSR